MPKYVISQRAEEDIDEILAYIAADSVAAAISLNDRFTHLFEMFADHPEIGRERPELREDLRSFPEGSYVIFYRIWAGQVAIVRVLHGATDLDRILD